MEYKEMVKLIKKLEKELFAKRDTRTGGTHKENVLLNAQMNLMSAKMNIEIASDMEKGDD